MAETILFGVLCLAIGYLSHDRLNSWWYHNRPVRCPVCGHWCSVRNTLPAQHRVAGFVRICRSCWQAEYQPFGEIDQ